ncbi:MAG TPA: Gfo/Idh/MocA family oxidoreductase [Acidobacteriota bacterium]|nr:Gfo/Idh/MocA family oxidoreductase [Acidobacteriota bacterium]
MTAARKINWGVLGCAGIAEKAFIPAVLRSRNGALAAIASRDESRAADWARRFGFLRSHRTYQELVDDPAVDAVYNPLPNDLHAEWSIRAMCAGKHVLCEKPLALNAPEARAMIQAAEESGVLLMEGFMYKFHPQIDKALELIRAGAIGEPRSVHSSFTFRFARDGSNYRWSPAQGGGALYDVGCYTISIARLVLGAEPLAVSAAAHSDPATGVDLTTATLLEFPGGRFAQCDSSFETHFQSRLIVAGADGTLGLARAFSAKDFDVAVEIVRGDSVEALPIRKANMFTLMIEHFADAAAGEAPLRYPASDAWNNMRAIDACFESVRSGERVLIPA